MTLFRNVRAALVAGAVMVAGCAAPTYDLTLMPRSSGKLYRGEAQAAASGREAQVTVSIEDRVYAGTWVQSAPERTTGYVAGGWGWRHGGLGIGSTVSVENPDGPEAKALLQSADGGGLRCDLRGMGPGRAGSGTCQDDRGVVYDVQIRIKETK